jgi:hypothetical protein
MYNSNTQIDRNFMRRMIRSYEQDLLEIVRGECEHPNHAQIEADLRLLDKLRGQTFSPLAQTVSF